MKKTLLTRIPLNIQRRVLSVLAIMLIAGLIPFGLNLAAKASPNMNTDTEVNLSVNAIAQTLESLGATSGVKKGQWITYTANGTTYAYKAEYDIESTAKLAVDGTDASKLVISDHAGVNDWTELSVNNGTLTAANKSGSEITLTVNAGTGGNHYSKDTVYYYEDNGNYYAFQFPTDIGYTADSSADARFNSYLGEAPDTLGEDVTVTIDTADGTISFGGRQLTKHYIYQETTSFTAGNIYLVGSKTTAGNQAYVLTTGAKHDTARQDEDTTPNNHVNSAATYESTVTRVDEYIGRNASMGTLANGRFSTAAPIRNYVDGGLNADDFKNMELLTEEDTASNGLVLGIVSFGSKTGLLLKGFDDAEGDYTKKRVFGSIYSWTSSVQSELIYHENCRAISSALLGAGTVAHNNGNVWSYEYDSGSYYLTNNNTFAGISLSGGANKLRITASGASGTTSNNSRTPITLYQMKVAYESETLDIGKQDIYPEANVTGTLQAKEIKDTKVTLDYDGSVVSDNAKERKFNVSFVLTDNKNRPAANYTFTLDGNEYKTDANGRATVKMKHEDVADFGKLPLDFKLNISVTKPDQDKETYTFDILNAGEEASAKNVSTRELTVDGNQNSAVIKAYDPVRDVTIKMNYDGTGSFASKTFPVQLTLLDRDGNALKSDVTLTDFNGYQYTFASGTGLCTQRSKDGTTEPIALGNGQQIYFPGEFLNGYQLKVDATPDGTVDKVKSVEWRNDGSTTKKDATGQYVLVDNNKVFEINVQVQSVTTYAQVKTTYSSNGGSSGYRVITYQFFKKGDNDTDFITLSDPIELVSEGKSNDASTKYSFELQPGEELYVKVDRLRLYVTKPNSSGISTQDPDYGYLNVNGMLDSYYPKSDSKIYSTDPIKLDKSRNSSDPNVLELTGTSNSVKRVTYKNYTRYGGNKNKEFPLGVTLWQPQSPTASSAKSLSTSLTIKGVEGNYKFPAGSSNTNSTTNVIDFNNSSIPITVKNQQAYTILDTMVTGSSSPWTYWLQFESTNPGLYTFTDQDNKQYMVGGTGTRTQTRTRIHTQTDSGIIISRWGDDSYTELTRYGEWSSWTTTGTQTFRIGDGAGGNSSITESDWSGSNWTTVGKTRQRTEVQTRTETGSIGTGSLSGYRPGYNEDPETFYLFHDPILTNVTIREETLSSGGQSYANRNKTFNIRIRIRDDEGNLLTNDTKDDAHDDWGDYIKGAGWTETDKSDKEVFNGENGIVLTMKHGQERTIQVPLNYTVEVYEEDPDLYDVSYETADQTLSGGKWVKVEGTETSSDTLHTFTQKTDATSQDSNKAQIITIINTRDNVDDEIGLFGGTVNKAFLALVATLTTIAVAAYLYSKRYTETEDE